MKRSLSPLFLIAPLFLLGCSSWVSPDFYSTSRDSREKGIKLLEEKDYAHAVGAFRNAVKQEPRDYKAHYYLGVCYEELRQYPNAIQAYKTALAVPEGPDEEGSPALFRPQMLDALARVVASYDDRDTELNQLEANAKKDAKKAAENYMLLARIYRYRKDPDSALRCYQQAVSYGPNEFPVYKEYGLYLMDNLQMPKQAEQPLRRAYALNTNDDQVNNALRRLNIIPGPGLKDQNELAKPMIPRGPIPEVDVTKMFNRGQPQPAQATTPTPGPTRATPAAPAHD